MKSVLNEMRSAIRKSQKDIARYYNQKCTLVLMFYSGNKIFLNLLNIYITCSLAKLLHHCLKSYMVKNQVKLILYYLMLLSVLQRLYLIFSMVKLSTVSNNPIFRKYSNTSLDLVIYQQKREVESRKYSEQLLTLQKILISNQVKRFQTGSKLIGECYRYVCI